MINKIKENAENRMKKSIDALQQALTKIRTGRAHSSLLDNIYVDYYGTQTPLNQIAGITTQDSRTLAIRVYEKNLVTAVEKAILASDLGLNPSSAGEIIRVPLPPLTEETRKNYTRQAKGEAEQARVSIRNIRRDSVNELKKMEKDKEIGEDENHKAQADIQKITDQYIAQVDEILTTKERDLMAM